MAAITIKGIRIDDVKIKLNHEANQPAIEEATYSLISSTDHVLATQSINGYRGLTLKPSPETVKHLEAFMRSYKADALTVLGLDGLQ